MNRNDDDTFKVRPRPPRSSVNARALGFLQQVQREFARAGSDAGKPLGQRRQPGARTGRGFAAARLRDGASDVRTRRVIVKARVLRLKPGGEAVAAHLRYIARDGAGRDGASPNLPYDATSNDVDLETFQARGAQGRHQFRFIVAPEDAVELEDLRGFTRHLMDRVAADLGTGLDWVAVDHWDTDNPHTHIVLHGHDGSGADLVIAGEYIARGMRGRACELATSWLGPRTDAEIDASLRREIDAERWTSLDRQLVSRPPEATLSALTSSGRREDSVLRARLIGRLTRLQEMGLTRTDSDGSWILRPDCEQVLRRLGERGDIIRTMQRAFGQAHRELAVFDASAGDSPVVGRVADKGLAVTDSGDQSYLVVDGIDGRGHYVALPASIDLKNVPVGAIVEALATPERTADRNIAAAASNGLYVTRVHLAQLRASPVHCEAAGEILESHVRRLEALRRAGIVERVGDGVWWVPSDLAARGYEFDTRRHGRATVRVLCHLPIEQQVRAIGATWLDQQLVDGRYPTASAGFARSVGAALQRRAGFLIEKGIAQRSGSGLVRTSTLLQDLLRRELEATGTTISGKLGLPFCETREGKPIRGVYRESLHLISGRFAVVSNGLGFSLVPWKPVLEHRLGQALTAVVRDGRVSFKIGRARGQSIG